MSNRSYGRFYRPTREEIRANRVSVRARAASMSRTLKRETRDEIRHYLTGGAL